MSGSGTATRSCATHRAHPGTARDLHSTSLLASTRRTIAKSCSTQAQSQNERLLELDRVKDEFIALVSHELRTPLTSIRGYLELVVDDAHAAGQTGEQREWLRVIDRNADRLLSLVEDLLLSAQAHSTSVDRHAAFVNHGRRLAAHGLGQSSSTTTAIAAGCGACGL